MNSKKKIELLAPCGNIASLKAAVFNGADAIYLGGKSFGARALAGNFDHEELREAVAFCHLYGVRAYATVNTMVYEKELDNVFKEMDFLYGIGVDALIVADIGLLEKARFRYPDIELHISTQAHIHNVNGVRFMQDIGADRVVLARELPLISIKKIISAIDIETEVFVHGALCVSYSGQCLMGSILHERSGNRGLCSQCCRMRYHIEDLDEEKRVMTDGEYLLSTRDLNLLEHIPKLIEAGVASLKIEGRMKRPEYVAYVTRLYRMAIDAYYAGEKFVVSADMLKDLKSLFNRKFTKGHIFDDKHIYNPIRPNHMGNEVGKVASSKNGYISISFSEDIAQGDGLRILAGDKEFGLVANMMYRNGKLTDFVPKGEVGSFVYEPLPIGSKVYKTTDIRLTKRIKDFSVYRKVPITMHYKAIPEEPFYLRVSDGSNTVEVSGDIVQKAKSAPLDKCKIEGQLAKCSDTAYELVAVDGVTKDAFLALSQINAARRHAIEALNAKRIAIKERGVNGFKEHEPIPLSMPKYLIEVQTSTQAEAIKEMGIDAIIVTANKHLAEEIDAYYLKPVVDELGTFYNKNLSVVSQYGDLDGDIAYSSFNIASHLSVDFFLKRGFKAVILSLEISDEGVENLKRYYLDRFGKVPMMYVYVYGKRDLMQLKATPLLNAKDLDESHSYALVDEHGRYFKIEESQNAYRLLEHETRLLKRVHDIKPFIRFTDESAIEVRRVMKEVLATYK